MLFQTAKWQILDPNSLSNRSVISENLPIVLKNSYSSYLICQVVDTNYNAMSSGSTID